MGELRTRGGSRGPEGSVEVFIPLDDEQQVELHGFAARFAGRDIPPEIAELLCELRAMMIAARLGQEAIAERIAEIAKPPLPGNALPGHTRTGKFSKTNMSAELNFSEGRVPRTVVVDAIIQLYWDEVRQPTLDELYTHLRDLRRRATRAKRGASEASRGAASTQVAQWGVGDAAASPGAAPSSADAAELVIRIQELEAAQTNSSEELSRLTAEVYDLRDQLAAAKTLLEETETELTTLRARDTAQWRRLLANRAELDQLEGQVAALRRRLGDSWLDRIRRRTDESGAFRSEGSDQYRTRPDAPESTGSVGPRRGEPRGSTGPRPGRRAGGRGSRAAGGPSRGTAGESELGGVSTAPVAEVSADPASSRRLAGWVLSAIPTLVLAVVALLPLLPGQSGSPRPGFASCLAGYYGTTSVENNSRRSIWSAFSSSLDAGAFPEPYNYDLYVPGRLVGTLTFTDDGRAASSYIQSNDFAKRRNEFLAVPSTQVVKGSVVARLDNTVVSPDYEQSAIRTCGGL